MHPPLGSHLLEHNTGCGEDRSKGNLGLPAVLLEKGGGDEGGYDVAGRTDGLPRGEDMCREEVASVGLEDAKDFPKLGEGSQLTASDVVPSYHHGPDGGPQGCSDYVSHWF